MRVLIALALALATAGCHTATALPAPPVAAGAAAAVFTGTRTEALAHLGRIAPSCPVRVSLELSNGLDEAFCKQACATLNAQTGAWCHHYRTQGSRLTISISYTDYCLMLGVHEGRLPATRLSPAQAKAYARAREMAEQAAAAHSDDYGRALALHDRLALDNEYSERVSPEGHVCSLMLDGKGLCECYAGSYYLLARMAGLECRFVEGETKGTGHVWNLVRLGGQWVHVDCTYDDPTPDRKGQVLRHYFGMDDATIAHSHRWKRADHPACTDGSLWYPRRHSPRFDTLDAMAAALIGRAAQEGDPDTMEAYVEEVAQHPKHAKARLQAAVNKHRRSMVLEQDSTPVMAGYVTLRLQGKPQAPRARSGRRPGAGR